MIKIMPLGDSFTSGRSGSDYVGRSGYRQPLYDTLINYGYKPAVNVPLGSVDFNFVGSVIQPSKIPSVIDTFDVESEGHSGWQAGNLQKPEISLVDHIKSFLEKNSPDVILLHIGTNDISDHDTPQNIVKEVSSILDSIYSFNSNIVVILAKIVNRVGGSYPTTEYNNDLQSMYEVREKKNRLFLADMENGAGINYQIDSLYPFNEGKDMKDTVHPNDAGYRKMAEVWFNKLQELFTVKPSYPENGSHISQDSITFNWEKTLGSSSFTLQIAKDSLFGGIVYDLPEIPDTFKVINSLEKNSVYYWRVRSKINSGSGPYSETRRFSTESITAAENPENPDIKYSLEQNYPNPFNPVTVIKFSIPESGLVTMKVYNLLGEQVAQLLNNEMERGVHSVNFNGSNFSSGTYFYTVTVNGFVATKKMILVK